MKTVGIIAEYNPFHNGHAYQLRELKKSTGADFVVIAMSGDYVQRGEPALVDKYVRTQMALENGADLVLELPVQWATASAEKFAQGGVELLAATGVVDFLGFGAEDDALSLMRELAQILADEPKPYRTALGDALRTGVSFPTARMLALKNYLTANHTEPINDADAVSANQSVSADSDALTRLLSLPNNILALEYLKAIRRGNYRMEPILIPRVGDDYHEENAQSEYASATAIRRIVLENYVSEFQKQSKASDLSTAASEADKKLSASAVEDCLKSYLPTSCADILSHYPSASHFLCADDFSQILGYRLLSQREIGYDAYADISPELSSRILRRVDDYRNFSQFCELLKTKELTYTRISRGLLHLVLDIHNEDTLVNHLATPSSASTDMSQNIISHIPYLRILGFRRGAEPLLHEMKQRATLPIISKMADAPRILDVRAQEILQKEIFVSDLYTQIAGEPMITKTTTLKNRDAKYQYAQKTNPANYKPVNEINHGIILV